MIGDETSYVMKTSTLAYSRWGTDLNSVKQTQNKPVCIWLECFNKFKEEMETPKIGRKN